jgi:hypothetical protein
MANVNVEIVGKNKLGKTVDSAKQSLGGLKSAISGLALKTFGAAAIVGGIVAIGKAALQTATEVRRFSQETGLSTDSVQALRIAMTRATGSSGQLTELLEKLGESQDAVASGSKPLTDAFKKLGLTADKVVSMSMQELLQHMSEVKDEGALLSASFDIFGGKGATMANVIQGLNGDFAAFTEQLIESGNIMDSEFIDKAAITSEKLKEIGGVLQNVLGKAVVSTFEFLKKFFEAWAQGWYNAYLVVERVLKYIGQMIGAIIDPRKWLDIPKIIGSAFVDVFKIVARTPKEMAQAWGEAGDKINQETEQMAKDQLLNQQKQIDAVRKQREEQLRLTREKEKANRNQKSAGGKVAIEDLADIFAARRKGLSGDQAATALSNLGASNAAAVKTMDLLGGSADNPMYVHVVNSEAQGALL